MEVSLSAQAEALATIKQDRRDIWDAIAEGRKEDKRIETIVHQIAKDVAKQNVIFLIINAVIVALIVRYLGG